MKHAFDPQMTLAIIGADGAGIFLLFGLIVLTLVSVPWFVLEIILACKRKTYFSIPALFIAIFIFPFLYSYYSDIKKIADAEINRKKDAAVVVRLTKNGDVMVDGVSNSEQMIFLRGKITFSIDFADSRGLSGICSEFHFHRADGEFRSMDLRGISISDEDRLAFISSMPPSPGGTPRYALTDTYSVQFDRDNQLFNFTCQSRAK